MNNWKEELLNIGTREIDGSYLPDGMHAFDDEELLEHINSHFVERGTLDAFGRNKKELFNHKNEGLEHTIAVCKKFNKECRPPQETIDETKCIVINNSCTTTRTKHNYNCTECNHLLDKCIHCDNIKS